MGIQPRWGRQAEPITRADGTGTVPWTLPITQDGLARLLGHIRTACILTIAALSGMRTSELIELPLDCQLAPRSYGPGRVRHGPPNTSRTCPACGHTAKENRPTQDKFHCVACGHNAHADTVAATNVLRAGLARRNANRHSEKPPLQDGEESQLNGEPGGAEPLSGLLR